MMDLPAGTRVWRSVELLALKFHPGSACNIDPDGQRDRFCPPGEPDCHESAVFEAPALAPGCDDIAMMDKAVEQRLGHLSNRRRRRAIPLRSGCR
jgi:hypothetical protein